MNYENRDRQKKDSGIIVTWSILFVVAFILFFLFIDVVADIISHYKK